MTLDRWLIGAIATLVGITGASDLCAAPQAWDAKVLWSRADHAYVVLADSTAVEPGTRITFEEGEATIARGEVIAVHDGQLVSIRVTSGSLDGTVPLSSVSVFAEPPSIRTMPLLRVGYPSPGRPSLLFDCSRLAPRGSDRYRLDARSDRSYRFVRVPGTPDDGPWPDTILVRLFDVAADEEIALERGDLDVAIFWPGEPSPHIRSHTSWKGDPAGSWGGEVLNLEAPPDEAEGIAWRGSAAPSLRSMNDDLFRGDLSECAPDSSSAPSDSTPGATPPRIKFEVSRAIPGWQPLERRLNRGFPEKARPTLVVRVERVQPLVVVGASTARIARSSSCAFAIRCPVLSAPRLRPYVKALGPDALVELFTCTPKDGGR